MKLEKATALSLLAITFSPIAASAPQISSYTEGSEGTATITISGSDFGSSPGEYFMLDSADGYSYLENMSQSKPVDHENLWSQQGSNWASPLRPTSSSSWARGSDQIVYQEGGKAYMGWPEPLKDKSSDSLFVSWWFNPSSDPGANGGSNKFLRVWDSADGVHTRMAWDQMHIVYWRKDVDDSGFIQWGGWGGEAGQWNRIDAWMDARTNNMIIYVNGERAINVSDFRKSDINDALTVALIGFDPSVASNYPGFEFAIDDIVVSDSRARVEISNSEQWSEASRQSEIQVPTDWSDSRISFSLSTAIVDTSEPMYVYVVNDNGEVNETGFPLSSRAPSPVRNLTIE